MILNGKNSKPGSLVSPVLEGGISSISFKLAYVFSEKNNIDLTLTITGENGTVIVEKVVFETPEKNAICEYEYVLETAIEGNFTIEIVNNCPSDVNSNKDRASIWDLAWISA